jgi:hypothetical protein
MVAEEIVAERLVFVDECGTHTSLAPIYGYAPRGERLYLPIPGGRGENTTLLSSMSVEGMGPSLAVEGATTARVFETYVEKVLVPSLRAGQVVVMDNLGAHRPKRIGELIEQQGCGLLYLPAYSPDYKPHRGSLRQDRESTSQGHGQEQRGFGGSDGHGTIRGYRCRRPGLL